MHVEQLLVALRLAVEALHLRHADRTEGLLCRGRLCRGRVVQGGLQLRRPRRGQHVLRDFPHGAALHAPGCRASA